MARFSGITGVGVIIVITCRDVERWNYIGSRKDLVGWLYTYLLFWQYTSWPGGKLSSWNQLTFPTEMEWCHVYAQKYVAGNAICGVKLTSYFYRIKFPVTVCVKNSSGCCVPFPPPPPSSRHQLAKNDVKKCIQYIIWWNCSLGSEPARTL